jgi:hypothetical protein
VRGKHVSCAICLFWKANVCDFISLLTAFIMSTVLSHFGGLDELIQVIYQGADRFVALSQVTESAWSIYLGLKGPEGRWWRGSWSAQHILKITVRVEAVLLPSI